MLLLSLVEGRSQLIELRSLRPLDEHLEDRIRVLLCLGPQGVGHESVLGAAETAVVTVAAAVALASTTSPSSSK